MEGVTFIIPKTKAVLPPKTEPSIEEQERMGQTTIFEAMAEQSATTEPDEVRCPGCGVGTLILKHNSKRNTDFWGCSNYNSGNGCTYTQEIDPRSEAAAVLEKEQPKKPRPPQPDCPKCRGVGYFEKVFDGEDTPRMTPVPVRLQGKNAKK